MQEREQEQKQEQGSGAVANTRISVRNKYKARRAGRIRGDGKKLNWRIVLPFSTRPRDREERVCPSSPPTHLLSSPAAGSQRALPDVSSGQSTRPPLSTIEPSSTITDVIAAAPLQSI